MGVALGAGPDREEGAGDLALPSRLVATVEAEFGATGSVWLRHLPALLDRLAERWSLRLGRPLAGLSYHYVCAAWRRDADGAPCVLKVGLPTAELRSEAAALRHWDGRGAARLLASDVAAGALLLERLRPGSRLASLAARDDDAATLAGAAVMRALWRPPPSDPTDLLVLSAWFRDLREYRERYREAGRMPRWLVERGALVADHLLASTTSPVLLHGDLHHFNVLRAERAPWLAIDPKGLVGDRGFEVATFLRNPAPRARPVLERRLDLLSEALGLDRRRLAAWCFAEAALNACWSHVGPPGVRRRRVAWARLALSLVDGGAESEAVFGSSTPDAFEG